MVLGRSQGEYLSSYFSSDFYSQPGLKVNSILTEKATFFPLKSLFIESEENDLANLPIFKSLAI